MKNKNAKIILTLLLVMMFSVYSFAGTSISNTGDIQPDGVKEAADQIQKAADSLGPGMSNAYALSNVGGFPIGTSYLGKFPSFYLGFVLNAGLANMEYFDDDREKEQGVYPGVALNPAVIFGLGLGKGFDVMGKLFLFSDGFYMPPVDYEYAKLEKINIYSIGAKLRYQYIEKKIILPGLLEFNGLTFSAGSDMMYGKIQLSGEVSYPLDAISVDTGSGIKELNLAFDPAYSSELGWVVADVNVQAVAYMDFLWIFDFYTGFGLSGNLGFFNLSIDGSGVVTTDDVDYKANNAGSNEVATVSVKSDNKYSPYYIMPFYIVGFEADVYIFRISLESMVNLRNGSDVNVQIAVRSQF